MRSGVLQVLYVGREEGHGEVVPGEVGRAGDGERGSAGSEHRQHEVGVVGGEIREPEVAFSEDLRVNLREVAEVPEREEPGEEDGYLEEIEHGDERVDALLLHAHLVVVGGLGHQHLVARHLRGPHALAVHVRQLLQLGLPQPLDLRLEGRVAAYKSRYRKRVLMAMVAIMIEVAMPQFKSADSVTSSSRVHSSSP